MSACDQNAAHPDTRLAETKARLISPILVFLPSLGGGGAERHAVRLANAFSRLGIEVHIAVARTRGPYESSVGPKVNIHVCNRFFTSSGLSVYASHRPLVRLIRHIQPQVVMSFLPHTSVTLWKAIANLHPRPRFVVGIQNNPDCDRSSAVQRCLFGRTTDGILEHADLVIAISNGIGEQLVAKYDIDHKTDVIHNAAVDDQMQHFRTESVKVARPHSPLIIACGRLVEQKDYPTLVRAVQILNQQMECHLWILGTGSLRRSLESQVATAGLSQRVEFLGFQKNPLRFISAADVFVLSSRWEGFGNVIVEAMSCRVPVISTDCPHGPSDIISHRRTGILVPPDSAKSIAEAVREVLTDSELRRTLAENGERRARDFHEDLIAQQYLTSLTRMVEGSNDNTNVFTVAHTN